VIAWVFLQNRRHREIMAFAAVGIIATRAGIKAPRTTKTPQDRLRHLFLAHQARYDSIQEETDP
jgi:hypothetical protein